MWWDASELLDQAQSEGHMATSGGAVMGVGTMGVGTIWGVGTCSANPVPGGTRPQPNSE